MRPFTYLTHVTLVSLAAGAAIDMTTDHAALGRRDLPAPSQSDVTHNLEDKSDRTVKPGSRLSAVNASETKTASGGDADFPYNDPLDGLGNRASTTRSARRQKYAQSSQDDTESSPTTAANEASGDVPKSLLKEPMQRAMEGNLLEAAIGLIRLERQINHGNVNIKDRNTTVESTEGKATTDKEPKPSTPESKPKPSNDVDNDSSDNRQESEKKDSADEALSEIEQSKPNPRLAKRRLGTLIGGITGKRRGSGNTPGAGGAAGGRPPPAGVPDGKMPPAGVPGSPPTANPANNLPPPPPVPGQQPGGVDPSQRGARTGALMNGAGGLGMSAAMMAPMAMQPGMMGQQAVPPTAPPAASPPTDQAMQGGAAPQGSGAAPEGSGGQTQQAPAHQTTGGGQMGGVHGGTY
ncbi:Nucleoporin nup61 [Sphaceloma murrayae]|uniref:Nucleoporin nup61 n=1 Tax=Sphaceloma murrayae TaxID=2082308 RepID=A0A2K1QYW9_9PEZI|nr:Nucleoporin nup61 [Sphaceloma murrayae]